MQARWRAHIFTFLRAPLSDASVQIIWALCVTDWSSFKASVHLALWRTLRLLAVTRLPIDLHSIGCKKENKEEQILKWNANENWKCIYKIILNKIKWGDGPSPPPPHVGVVLYMLSAAAPLTCMSGAAVTAADMWFLLRSPRPTFEAQIPSRIRRQYSVVFSLNL